MRRKTIIQGASLLAFCYITTRYFVGPDTPKESPRFEATVAMDNYSPIVSPYSGYISSFLTDDTSRINITQPLYLFVNDEDCAKMTVRAKESGLLYYTVPLGEHIDAGQALGYILSPMINDTYYFNVHLESDETVDIGNKVQITDGTKNLKGVVQTLFEKQMAPESTKVGIVLGNSTASPILRPNTELNILIEDIRAQ